MRYLTSFFIFSLSFFRVISSTDLTPESFQTPDSSLPGVHLRILNKVTSKKTDLKIPMNQSVQHQTLTLTPRSCFSHPPELPHEASLYIEIHNSKTKNPLIPSSQASSPKGVDSNKIYANWMFASAPAINSLDHPEYNVTVISCLTKEELSKKGSPPPSPEKADI